MFKDFVAVVIGFAAALTVKGVAFSHIFNAVS